MIDQTQHIGRTRPWPLPTVLNAITKTIKRPGAALPMPRLVEWVDYVRGGGADLTALAEFPAATLLLRTGRVAGLAAWAAVLADVRVEVFPEAYQTTITVIGRTASGPVVSVYDHVSDWPLEMGAGHAVTITAGELAAVAADVSSADALAGAR